MTRFLSEQMKCKAQGIADAKAGKSIQHFYAMDLPRHSERLRAAYEIGWRWAREEQRKAEGIRP